MRKITVGTRGSALALCQTNWTVEQLKSLHPGLEIETTIIKTKGDRILDVPLAKIGDKGLFVKEIESALLNGEIDFAVHSLKDLPTEMTAGLCIAAVPEREDPSDALISNGVSLRDLPPHASIGSSSLRRAAQLRYFRGDLRVCDLRGNLDTRLRKLDAGEYDAIILAYAGLNRMGWADRITEKLSFDVCVPAVGQGALGIQARANDDEVLGILSVLEHPETRAAITAERSLMRVLEGGCHVPVGAVGYMKDGRLHLRGVVASLDGSRLIRGEVTGDDPDALGVELARELLARGADAILSELRDR